MSSQKTLIVPVSYCLLVLFVVTEAQSGNTQPLLPFLNINARDVSSISKASGTGDLDDITNRSSLSQLSESVPQSVHGILSDSALKKDKSTIVTKFPTNILTKNGRYLAVPPLIFNVAALLKVKLCNYGNVGNVLSSYF